MAVNAPGRTPTRPRVLVPTRRDRAAPFGLGKPAMVGARLGNFRLGYTPGMARVRSTRVAIQLAGVDVTTRGRVGSLTIHDALNDAPNTCALTVEGAAPNAGQALRVTINADTPRLLFNGALDGVGVSYQGKPAQTCRPVTAIDDQAKASARLPFGSWTDVSATTIGTSLATLVGMTAVHVEAGLPLVSMNLDGSEGMHGALTQLAKLIGGYWFWEDGDLWLFQTLPAGDLPDTLDSTPGRFLNDPPITASVNKSQVRTRVYGKGHGETTLTDVLAGSASIPVADASMFNALGGRAISETQQIAYTGVQLGGGGGLVGPGAAPSAVPGLALVAGSGLGTGVYGYAYTDVTALGESLPGPVGSVTTRASTAAPAAPTFNQSFAGTTLVGTYKWATTFVTVDGETVPSALLTLTTGSVSAVQVSLAVGPGGVIGRKLYRTIQGGSQLKLVTIISNNTATAYNDGVADGALGVNAPVADTTGGNQVAVSTITPGASGTTSRKLYRTVVGGSQLKLLATLADNTTTTYADSTADGSLGANVPTVDASGLAQPAGQLNAGSTSMIVAGTSGFASGGRWAVIGNGAQVIRYTGVTGTSLTGIPATGPGAILATVSYNSTITAAPALTGVTGLVLPLIKGAPINLWVQRDDLVAQTAAAARAADGSDGIIEHRIVDERRGEASLIALCDADLVQFSAPLVTVTYADHHVKNKSGKPVYVNFPSLASAGFVTGLPAMTLTMLTVDISEIDTCPGIPPRYAVVASNGGAISVESVLRKLAAGLEGL